MTAVLESEETGREEQGSDVDQPSPAELDAGEASTPAQNGEEMASAAALEEDDLPAPEALPFTDHSEETEDLAAKMQTLQSELQTHWQSSCDSLQTALQCSVEALSMLYQDGSEAVTAWLQDSEYWEKLKDKEYWAQKTEELKGEFLDRAEYAWDACWEEAEAFRGRLKEGNINPLYLFSISLLIVVLVFTGMGKLLSGSKRMGPAPDAVALRVVLPDGRFISYREDGVAAEEARHQILLVHGFLSSRLAGIPGIDSSLLEEFGVRLVSFDRPGYGQSDPHPSRNFNTSAQDMANIADALKLGPKFWVLGYGGGGPHAWAAINYIPERLAGVAMLAPIGNPYFGNMTKDERDSIWKTWTLERQLMYIAGRRAPSFLSSFVKREASKKPDRIVKRLQSILGTKDRALIEHSKFASSWEQDLKESVRQGLQAHVEEILLTVKDWGFSLSDLFHKSSRKHGFIQRWFGIFKTKQEEGDWSLPVHIWQGTDDRLVPASMNEFAKKMLPQVHLHRLESEGHFSFFCFCEPCHRLILRNLFGEPIGPIGRAAKVDDTVVSVPVA